ncbi:Protease-associated domain, PA, partial [Nannochloropsis gaditana]
MLFPRGTHCLSCRKRGFYIGRLFSVLAFASLAAPSLARPRHHVEYVPSLPISSGNAVVSNAMGVMEGAGGIEDETSRLQIQIPRDLFKPDGYNHKEALFGIPVYGGFIAEKLYYANTTKMCSAPTADEVAQWKSPYILMVDRGDCTFVTKVRHAQHAGASGVLVADNLCVCKDLACHPDPDTSCQGIEPVR